MENLHDTLIRSCPEVMEFLIDYLERKLPPLRMLQFRVHLRLCKDCHSYLIKYETGRELARQHLNDPPPEDLVNLTLDFIKKHK